MRTHATVESLMLSGEKTSSEITIPFCTVAHPVCPASVPSDHDLTKHERNDVVVPAKLGKHAARKADARMASK